MRADARLQRLQPRLGECRRKGLRMQVEVGEQRACREYRDGKRTRQARQRLARERAYDAVVDGGDDGDRCHDGDAAHPVAKARKQRRSDEEHDQFREQQRLEERRGVHEALQCTRQCARRVQRAGEGERIHRHQHARHDGEVAEVGQNVRIGVLPYTGHGYEQVLNRIQAHCASMASKPQPWSGRFREPVDERVKRFSASVDFDRRLARQDIAASLAHARMLARAGIIKKTDLTAIERGLARIRREIDKGEFAWSLDAEDVHLNIERRLTALAGEAGKRLHTARSRNDQVATDLRLWLREEIDATDKLLVGLIRVLVAQAERHAGLVMPGFTHLQVAQPVTFGHHMLAYVAMLERDRERLAQCRARVNQLPLGAAALAGTSFPIDRAQVAKELQFEGVSENSIDAVADRDFAIEFCACAAIAMMHLSRLAEELVLWSNPRYGFVRLPERYSTGSSIMPQKKNPDVPELARGKTGRVNGDLVALLTLMKGQPLAYNKDNQEDKEPLFDSVDTLRDTLRIMAEMVGGIAVKRDAMERSALKGYATATDLADYLAKKGVPFRDAHEVVAHAVKAAIAQGLDLAELPLETLRGFHA